MEGQGKYVFNILISWGEYEKSDSRLVMLTLVTSLGRLSSGMFLLNAICTYYEFLL